MHLNKPPVFYCSFPKSGRTWVRFILANYFNEKYSLDLHVDFNNMFQVLPNHDQDPQRGLPAYLYSDRDTIPLLIFDHSPFHQAYINHKVIFQMRDIFDTLVSGYFQAKNRLGQYPFDIKCFIREANFGVPRLAEYINSWSTGLDKTRHMILGYEQMHKDAQTTITNLLKFIQVDLDEAILENAINASNFQRMKKIEIDRGFPNPDLKQNIGVDNNALRAREGKVGNYTKYLDSKDIKYIKRTCDRLLNAQAKKLLSSLDIAY